MFGFESFYLGASLLSNVDGWICSITCKYTHLMLFLFYFLSYALNWIFVILGLIVALHNCEIVELLFLYSISQCMGHVCE